MSGCRIEIDVHPPARRSDSAHDTESIQVSSEEDRFDCVLRNNCEEQANCCERNLKRRCMVNKEAVAYLLDLQVPRLRRNSIDRGRPLAPARRQWTIAMTIGE